MKKKTLIDHRGLHKVIRHFSTRLLSLFCLFSFCVLLTGCEKFDGEQKRTNGSTLPQSVNAPSLTNNLGSVNVVLEKVENYEGDFCEIYITVNNNTNINFTNLNLVVLSRDSAKNIVSEGWFDGRVTPKGSGVFNSQWKYCSAISNMDFKFNKTTQINGNFVSGAEEEALMAIPIYTISKVARITTTPQQQSSSLSGQVVAKGRLPIRTESAAECAVVTLTMALYNKNTGNTAEGDKLMKYALQWGKTAFDIGAVEGVSADAVKAENQRLSANVSSNMAAFMQTATAKMNDCIALLKSDSQILSLWQANQN